MLNDGTRESIQILLDMIHPTNGRNDGKETLKPGGKGHGKRKKKGKKPHSLPERRKNDHVEEKLDEKSITKVLASATDLDLQSARKCSCFKIRSKKLKLLEREMLAAKVRNWMQVHGKKRTVKVSSVEREMYQKLFQLLDEDGSGALDFGEIEVALKLVGYKSSGRQLKEIVEKHSNDEGELDLNAFLLVIEESETQKVNEAPTNSRPPSGRAKKGQSPLERQRGLSCEEEKKSDEDGDDAVLPFHLFLPAFSRRKNVEFVMNLNLKESTKLPFVIEENAAAKTSSAEEGKKGHLPGPCKHCQSRPIRLRDIDMNLQRKEKG